MSYNRLYSLLSFIIISNFFAGCSGNTSHSKSVNNQPIVTPEEARAIAKEAFIYAYPMADGYRIQYAYFVEQNSPEYKAPYNVLYNTARVYTPEDKAVQTPNSDTPYSFAGLDLRAEPYVITVPNMEKDRYFSIQFIDYYTHNFDYVGSRVTGNEGGNFLIAGPDWTGETPAGITKVLHSETQLVIALIRTQLFNSSDLENVKKVQEGYKLQSLSAFLGKTSPPPPDSILFVPPLSHEKQKNSLEIFTILNFQLQFCPTHPSETELMERFAKIGIGAGQKFDTTAYSGEIKTAMIQGIADAWSDFAELKKRIDNREVSSGDVFGTREFLKNNYLYRMAGAIVGIYGNSKNEAMYPIYTLDSKGNSLNGENKYVVRFEPGQTPPAHGFWSLTMYELPASLLVSNSINRYLINSPMLAQLKKDPDGGISLYIQSTSPGKVLESNWLPAPKAPFMVVMRIYWPKEEALNGTWKQPQISKVN